MFYTVLPGKPYPLGAKASSLGTNFAVYSEHATRVQVCLFDEHGHQTDCVDLHERTAFVWHGLIRDIRPGQRYGLRVDGPWDPEQGLRFNPHKLLVDPYAEAICGKVDWHGPEWMAIPLDKILFIEKVGAQSQLATLIATDHAQENAKP